MVIHYSIKTGKNRRGRGIALYVRDTLQCCINSRIKTFSKTESIWVDIKEGSQSVAQGVVYRPLNSTKEINSKTESIWVDIKEVDMGRY